MIQAMKLDDLKAYQKWLNLNCPSEMPVKFIEFVQHKGKPPGYTFAAHKHVEHELIYVDYGKTLIKLDGKEILLCTGDCIIISSGVEHTFQSFGDKPLDFLNIDYKGDLFSSIAGMVFNLSQKQRAILDTLKRESQEKLPNYSEILFLKLNELLFLLKRDKELMRKTQNIQKKRDILEANKREYNNKIVQSAIDYLYDSSNLPLDVDTVAVKVGVSKSYLRHILKKHTGESLRQHLRSIRLQNAVHLLRESSYNIEEVAYKVGYNSVPHFCNIFKCEFKMTPGEYSRSLGLPDN